METTMETVGNRMQVDQPKEGKRVRRAPGRGGALFWQELIGQERAASIAQSPRATPKLDVRPLHTA